MDNRLILHSRLIEILGSERVYFQAPESIKLIYPCILYKKSVIDIDYANDKVYNYHQSYEVTIIDEDPDTELVGKMLMSFKKIKFNRHYVADNLNHYVFNVYY